MVGKEKACLKSIRHSIERLPRIVFIYYPLRKGMIRSIHQQRPPTEK